MVSCAQVSISYQKEDFGEVPIGTDTFFDPSRSNKAPFVFILCLVSLNALVITGFAYTLTASQTYPKNMLMIIGKWDEFRQRMTGTRDIEKEWMRSERTKEVFPVENPEFGVTYGDFSQGTARRVFLPKITHVQESHHNASIGETVEWLKEALLAITSLISTFFFLLTGKIYLGAFVNAAMVTWIFASSQVIAPIPV